MDVSWSITTMALSTWRLKPPPPTTTTNNISVHNAHGNASHAHNGTNTAKGVGWPPIAAPQALNPAHPSTHVNVQATQQVIQVGLLLGQSDPALGVTKQSVPRPTARHGHTGTRAQHDPTRGILQKVLAQGYRYSLLALGAATRHLGTTGMHNTTLH